MVVMIKKLLCTLGLVAFFGLGSVSAEAAFTKKTYVQLKTFFLPVQTSKGRRHNVPITVYLVVKDDGAPKKICPTFFVFVTPLFKNSMRGLYASRLKVLIPVKAGPAFRTHSIEWSEVA